jgi:hypothetical protein
MNTIRTTERTPQHKKTKSMITLSAAKDPSRSTKDIFETEVPSSKRKSFIYNRNYVAKPKVLDKQANAKKLVTLFPLNYLPSISSPVKPIHNSSTSLDSRKPDGNKTNVKPNETPSTLYKKVFDKNYQEMSRYNKFNNNKELFLIHPEKYEIPHRKESGLENKLKEIKNKVAFIKSIYDYSYPLVMMEKMKSMRDILKFKDEQLATIGSEYHSAPRKSIKYESYMDINKRKETAIILSSPMPISQDPGSNNYRVFKLVNV